MDYKEKLEKLKTAISELKDDISTLNRNIEQFEEIMETINSEEDLQKHSNFDIEHGLNHIRLF